MSGPITAGSMAPLMSRQPPESLANLHRGAGYAVLFLAWSLWMALVIGAPLLRLAGLDSIASGIYEFFGLICHQRPERSFAFAGHALAVCHRCTGLYLGLGVGLLILPWLPGLRRRLDTAPRTILLFALPMLIDFSLGEANVPVSRVVTGIVASFPIALFCWMAAEQIVPPGLSKLGLSRLDARATDPSH